jgi:hypothetical protein
MSITTLWRTVRGRWHDLVQQLWPDSPEERTRAEIAHLTDDLARREKRLIRLRQRIERLLGRTDAGQERVQRRLARLEEVYQEGCRQLDRRKRLRQALLRGRMQVVEVIHGPGRSAEDSLFCRG